MIEALQFEFMRNALAAGLLASIICGIMGTLVVVNRIVFLSGGIDSTIVACIAADAIGAGHVHGISMPSRYSSDHSKSDAQQLAEKAAGVR